MGELSNVQLAFDTLMGTADIVGVQPHLGASKTAINTWTGFPKKSDGTAIRIDGEVADLTGYMRPRGPSGDETFYFYCWDAEGRAFQHMISHPCP